MGTALLSASDRDEEHAIREMLNYVKDQMGAEKRRELDRAIGDRVRNVIFEGQDIQRYAATVKAAIAKQVKDEILSKYTSWVNDDKKDPTKWPFKE